MGNTNCVLWDLYTYLDAYFIPMICGEFPIGINDRTKHNIQSNIVSSSYDEFEFVIRGTSKEGRLLYGIDLGSIHIDQLYNRRFHTIQYRFRED